MAPLTNPELALHGGPKTKTTPFHKGRRHGELDKKYLSEVIDSDVLFYYLGTKVNELQKQFAQMYGMKHCVACSSGTAAVHMAVAALELPPGTEVITSAITDMGSLTGILYQNLVPVFADVEADTLNVDPDDVERRITSRTGAIQVVHHAGLAADMGQLLDIGRRHNLPVLEDCAQAYLCKYRDHLAGTMGLIGAFSLNHYKHITCGSGGMILTNDDRVHYYASLFLDKCYQREEGKRNPFFLAPNYQMTELQGAVALAQIQKVRDIVERRNALGQRLTQQLLEVPHVATQRMADGCQHAYFLYLFRLKLDELTCDAIQFSAALEAEGIPNRARQITGGMVVYAYQIFQQRSAYPRSACPFVCECSGANREYRLGECPVAERAFDEWITLDFSEHYSDQDIDEIALAIRKVAEHYSKDRPRG